MNIKETFVQNVMYNMIDKRLDQINTKDLKHLHKISSHVHTVLTKEMEQRNVEIKSTANKAKKKQSKT